MKKNARRTLKTIATGTLAAALLAVGTVAASAHVHAVPDSTAADGYTHVTFTVPNESASAATNKITVQLPTDPPFTSVSVKSMDGWSAKLITTTLPKAVTVEGSEVTKAVTSVEWTADSEHQIGQNEYQTFALSLGKLPGAGATVMLPVLQAYTDGSVVKWDEKTVAGKAEPEHPAPFFVTTGAVADDDAVSSPSTGSGTVASDSPTTLSIWGIVLGGAGLLLGGIALGLVLSSRAKSVGQ